MAATTFTFITAGHSSSARHSNLFNQSYTASMEQAARSTFAILGVDFVVKNYSMGSSMSRPELAICKSALYVTNVGVLWWDFAVNEGYLQNWLYNL